MTHFWDAISEADLSPLSEDDVDEYLDGSCPKCGAGPDELCADDCTFDEDDEEDQEFL